MKKVVIDINILMDFLFKRKGHEKTAELFSICSRNKIKGYVCAHEITTLYYFLNKTVKDKSKIKKSISGIMNSFEIIEVNAEILNRALGSEVADFEDAVIEVSAKMKNSEFIVTRNIRDFKKSTVNAILPEELLVLLKRSKNEND
jgi:predicted nucleic acid-binding protein